VRQEASFGDFLAILARFCRQCARRFNQHARLYVLHSHTLLK